MEYEQHVVSTDTTRLSFSSLYSLGSSVYSHVKGVTASRPASLADFDEHEHLQLSYEGSHAPIFIFIFFVVTVLTRHTDRAECVANSLGNRTIRCCVSSYSAYKLGISWVELESTHFVGQGECASSWRVVAWKCFEHQWRCFADCTGAELGYYETGTASTEIAKSHTDTTADKWDGVF